MLDYGAHIGPGLATHSLTLYRKNSGFDQHGVPITSLVFGAGTVQWSWGLDGSHSMQASTPDIRMQQATVNVLADMGVPAATLQPGLVGATASTDTVAPTTTITTPSAGSTIPVGRHVTIRGGASDSGGGTVAGVELSFDGGASWHPARGTAAWSYDWVPATVGAVTILSRATDDSGNIGTAGTGVPVSVVASDCPCSSLWSPALAAPTVVDGNDANAIEVGVRFTSDVPGFISGIRFYKSVANNGTHIGNLWTASGTLKATAVFSSETLSGWQEVSFPSPVAIEANTTYVASYHTNLGHYSADRELLPERRRFASAARVRGLTERAQRRLRLRPEPVPGADVPCAQLLGRRDVRRGRDGFERPGHLEHPVDSDRRLDRARHVGHE